jgi:hypothetical protein
MSAAQIRITELAIHSWPPGSRIMAVLTGYFDDSRTDGLIFTLAGYVGGERHWEVFQEQWHRALDLHEAPYAPAHYCQLTLGTSVADNRHRIVGEYARHGWQVADVTVHDAKQGGNRSLICGDAARISTCETIGPK